MVQKAKNKAINAYTILKGIYALTVALAEIAAAYVLYFQSKITLQVIAVILLSHAGFVLASKFINKDN